MGLCPLFQQQINSKRPGEIEVFCSGTLAGFPVFSG